jgi:hypothetical protein
VRNTMRDGSRRRFQSTTNATCAGSSPADIAFHRASAGTLARRRSRRSMKRRRLGVKERQADIGARRISPRQLGTHNIYVNVVPTFVMIFEVENQPKIPQIIATTGTKLLIYNRVFNCDPPYDQKHMTLNPGAPVLLARWDLPSSRPPALPPQTTIKNGGHHGRGLCHTMG